ncbi:PGAP1-like protein [Cyclonatronum proteinivorum]|uniref:PGAP1-like protein n=1 Tax=Cyclonatronum proteinivorum TaxID=1457365 RepID=A0A345UNW5_9BACT|nr:hypothetical protein [Cyclonatronum proteinivorum]AXJ02167.1 PGAP1-like protein [Cyclonatronum proteinivorum]
MAKIKAPFYPIIYIRGYAMRQSDIDDTTSTPYMGFNLGTTKIRQNHKGEVRQQFFESPLIRLMKDFGYTDNYAGGEVIDGDIPAKSVIIHRYYDQADGDFGTGAGRPSIEQAAEGLSDLILKTRDQVCGDDAQARQDFRVYLVAHSMGGLIARCLLQNDAIGDAAAKAMVDKVFTYGTPHNGIEIGNINVSRFLSGWDMNNFNRRQMAAYLGLDAHDRVDTLNGKFPEDRFFSLVGTNPADYGAMRRVVGSLSDGLVLIRNASVQGAPRAYTHHSHSGAFGLVNSEEGYQNLTRFLFGDVAVKAVLHLEDLPLPPSVQKALNQGRRVRVSYYFENTVMVRGEMFKLSERKVDNQSAGFKVFDELFAKNAAGRWVPKPERMPVLFTAFLDSSNIETGRTLVFTVDLAVKTTEYEIDGRIFRRNRIPGENLYREQITLKATRSGAGFNLRYALTDEGWGENRGSQAEPVSDGVFRIPLKSGKGFKGALELTVSRR